MNTFLFRATMTILTTKKDEYFLFQAMMTIMKTAKYEYFPLSSHNDYFDD